MNNKKVYLHQIATHLPKASFSQETVLKFMLDHFDDTDGKHSFLKKIYNNSAVSKRYSVIEDYDKSPEEYKFFPKNATLKPEPSTFQRNELYILEASRLSIEAVKKLLNELPRLDKNKITHIITVSCTGFSAPGFDFDIIKELGLNLTINRFHLGFMGCFAAFPALKLARNICLSEPDAKVLVVNVELCSLHFQLSSDPDILIANSLFADGITAALISSEVNDTIASAPKIVMHDFLSLLIPGSDENMTWKIGETGFKMRLSSYVPQILDQNMNLVMAEFKKKTSIPINDVELWAIHPGGRAILDRLYKTLGSVKEDFSPSYDVLNEYGNMSSATIMFVLARILENNKKGRIFTAAFGPGLTVETGYLEKI
ncbi:MAG: type III polyketide synthase [Oligoflexia bacterium]|nr:type III polyketide synthase [Oligoflexia bacterium]